MTKNLFLTLSLLVGISSCTLKPEKASTDQQETVLISTGDPLADLISGNERFYTGKAVRPNQDTVRLRELSAGQHPKAVVVSCSDSRVTPAIVFDQGLGDIFSIRTAGNVMSAYDEGSIEYAVEHADAKLVVVLGHTHCGAIKAMLEHADEEEVHGQVGTIINALKSQEEEREVLAHKSDNVEYNAVRANVTHGVKQLRNSEPTLKAMSDKGAIRIVGAIYDIESGKVEFLDL